MKQLTKLFVVAAVGFALSVQAVPTLRLSADGGATWTTIVDQVNDGLGGVPDDGNPLAGVVVYVGGVNANWAVTVTTGLTMPFQGTPARPYMDLNSITATSVGAGSLIIQFSEVGFGPVASGNVQANIGGVVLGSVGSSLTYNTFAGAALWDQTTALTSQGPFSPGAFSGIANGPAYSSLGATFSLTQEILLTHTTPGSSSFNAELTVPEGGTTLMLLGSALTVLGVFRRKFATKA